MRAQGVSLGPYRLMRPLRDAQVGSAFLATRTGVDGFEKRVVIRCAERAAAARVVEEASRAASISHSGIAHVLDAGVEGDVCFVVTERASGPSLRALLVREGRLPWRTVARVVADVAEALAYAHTRRREDGTLLSIVHGRVRPRRITLGHGGRAKLTGLGTSWAWPRHDGFASPEERRGEPLDGRADVFSLGRTLRTCADAQGAPAALLRCLEGASEAWPERRFTALELHESLSDLLAGYSPAGVSASSAAASSATISSTSASASAAAAASASSASTSAATS